MNLIFLFTTMTLASEPAAETTTSSTQNTTETTTESIQKETENTTSESSSSGSNAATPTQTSSTESNETQPEKVQDVKAQTQEAQNTEVQTQNTEIPNTETQNTQEQNTEAQKVQTQSDEGENQQTAEKVEPKPEAQAEASPQRTQQAKLDALDKERQVSEGHAGGHFTVEAMWNQSSGPVRSVLIALLLMLVACFGVALERAMFIGRARRQSKNLVAKIMPHLQKGDHAGAYGVAQDKAFSNCYLGILLSAGLREFDARQDNYGIEAVERALDKSNVTISESLTEWFGILATTGATAPFVGLVGTIFGIINAFSMIGSDGGADLTTLAPAIGEALITTAFGIIVALVGVWLFNYFTAKVDSVTNEVTRSAQDLIDWCHKQVEPPFDQKDAAK